VAQAEMLANRLRKVAHHRRKWARREDIGCYRLYDRDIPEIPLVIDWYEGRLHVARWHRPLADDDPRERPAWLSAMAAAAAAALEVGPDDVFIKERRRQRGRSQYTRVAEAGRRFLVSEGGLRFWVNLSDYLDTGLFLDHRITRARVGAEAAGKRLLNLFCYTGAFTVHAAAGGAAASLSVDLSATYLAWAKDNLAANGLDDPRHELLRADVLTLLEGRPSEPFDLAVLDPPTFSNSKKMQRALDVRRDHVPMVRATLRWLRPGGVLYFSSNARHLSVDPEDFAGAEVADITAATIPPDFAGRHSHRCWRFAV
jgi:23S rRNA G2069 N7-methylase RlmK/C1962 C5-methylase RlmI